MLPASAVAESSGTVATTGRARLPMLSLASRLATLPTRLDCPSPLPKIAPPEVTKMAEWGALRCASPHGRAGMGAGRPDLDLERRSARRSAHADGTLNVVLRGEFDA